MKKTFLAIAVLTVVCVGCAKQQDSSSVGTSSSSASADWAAVHDTTFGLKFFYPSAWGKWQLSESPSEENTDATSEMTFSELDKNIQFPQTGMADVSVIFRRFDGQYRYEEITGYEDDVSINDLLKEKNDFLQKAQQTIDGTPAMIQDIYDVPSGYVIRNVEFYTGVHRVRMYAMYDVGGFLQSQGPSDVSLGEKAQKILGLELSDPIHRLSKMYPQDLKALTQFYSDVDQFIGSIKISK